VDCVVSVTPVVDLVATAAECQMVVEIGRIYGCELNLERGRELALSLKNPSEFGDYQGSDSTLNSAATECRHVCGWGAIQGVTAAYLTHIAGKSFIEYFRHDQDWGDGGMTEVVQRQFQLNRREEFMKAFVQDDRTGG